MRQFISCLLSVVVFCGLTQVGEAALVITEIMNNPSDASDGNTSNSAEWFELYN